MSEAPASLTVQVKSIPPIAINNVAAPSAGLSTATIVPSLISAIVTLVGTFFALYFGFQNTKTSIAASERTAASTLAASASAQDAAIWQKANEVEAKDLQAALDGFYAKFQQLTEINGLLYSEFRSRQPHPETFFFMDKLFDADWKANLSVADKAMLAEIISNGDRLQHFILDNTTSIDSKIVSYFSRAAAHFRILRLAYDGQVGTDPTNLKKYLYPRQLNKVLALELERIHARQHVLRSAPAERHPPMPELAIPASADYVLPNWANPPVAPVVT